MARAAAQPESITVHYDLHELPTAQHKAGLAGLLLQIESMKQRRERGFDLGEPPTIDEQTPTSATFTFTEASTRALFDDLYDAAVVEASVKSKWQGATLKRTDEVMVTVDGKEKKEARYVYDVVQPTGPFLRSHVGEEDAGAWHKLWRDMLWQIPRGRPTTRGPFNKRSVGGSSGEGEAAWKDLVAHVKAQKEAQVKLVKLAGAVMLGAQAVTAESVTFEDRADHALLLHFWQLTVQTYVPEMINADGKREFVGYVLTIPEVRQLNRFNHVYLRGLGQLDTQRRGYRPRAAVISLAVQGPLEFMRHLSEVGESQAVEAMPTQPYLAGVEFFHLIKAGNNIKTVTHGRLSPRPELLRQYSHMRERIRNPLLLAARLGALVADEPWFARLAKPLLEQAAHWFVHCTKPQRTPLAMIGFAYEVFDIFQQELALMSQPPDSTDRSDVPEDHAVDRIVFNLVKAFVNQKAAARAGLQLGPDFNWKHPEFQEQRGKVAQSLFLELRSRRDESFVQHFTAALGSVGQYLPEGDYAAVTAALLRPFSEVDGQRTRDDIKTLTLLALSANSRSLTTQSAAAADAPEGAAS